MFHHYGPVWELLNNSTFDLVLYGDEYGRHKSRLMASSKGYNVVDYEKVIEHSNKYPVFVSNHSMYEYNKRPINFILGIKQVRFMYALGKAKHNFSSWNDDYDLILCFGPFQEQQLKKCCSATIFQMGYPRYDRYFSGNIDKLEVAIDLGIDTNKQTLVWVPTWKELSTIDHYADVMSSLSSKYNVIVKTHPLSVIEEIPRLRRLKKHNFTKIITDVYDNLDLYAIADWVVSDYGGTAFGAIYLDKPLLLLNISNAEDDHLTGSDSPDILLRKSIVNVDVENRWSIMQLLLDESLWLEQKAHRKSLRQEHFFPSYGFSANLAATALQNIDNILNMA